MSSPKSQKSPKQPSKEPVFTQSQSPWEDPDTPIIDKKTGQPRPMTFDEMVYTDKNKRQPRMDMDTDLGA